MKSQLITILLVNVALIFGAMTAQSQVADKDEVKSIKDCASALDKTRKDGLTNLTNARESLCETLARFGTTNQSVPDSPAFVAQGITTENVVRPTNPSDFVTTFLNGVDPNGNLQTGIAIDTNPYMVFFGDEVTLAKYQNNIGTRLAANTQLSFATSKASDDDESTRVAVGLHLTPWMAMDPRGKGSSMLNCLARRIDTALDKEKTRIVNPLNLDGTFKTDEQLEKEDEIYRQRLQSTMQALKTPATHKDCEGKFQKAASNSSGWVIGFTPSWISKSDGLGDFDDSSFALWSSLAFNLANLGIGGMQNAGQAIFHLRYMSDEQVADSANTGQFIEQDSLVFGGKLRFDGPASMEGGTFKNIKFDLEASYIDADRVGLPDDSYYQFGGNAQFQLPKFSEEFWIDLSFGSTTARKGQDNSFARFGVKWNFNDTSSQ